MAQIREIDVGTVQTRFARGWHCLGLLKTFKDGKPHAIEAFGTKLVVFADSKGDIKVLDGYCRHMGGDLTQGEVKGDSIACPPFHDWRWGRQRQVHRHSLCSPRASARTHPRVDDPRAERSALRLERPRGQSAARRDRDSSYRGAYSDEWTDWTWNSMVIEGSNCREIIDNVVDMAHFYYIHYAFPTYFKNVFEGEIATQYLNTTGRPDIGMASQYGGDTLLRSEAAYYGPSYMVNPLWNSYSGYEVESVLINCHYPISPDSFVLQWGGVTVKKPTGVSDEMADKLAGKFTEGISEGFLQDVAIWKNKTKIENPPLLCEEDGPPVYQLRRWYEQFYVDKADVTEKMTQRFEFEVDTTKANEAWHAEVEENLARQKAEKEAAAEAAKKEAEV